MQLYDMTISELSVLIKERKISAQELTQAYLQRIDEVEEQVGAFITRTDELAIQQAGELDHNPVNKPLAGIPYGLKDNICTRGVRTTCASKMLGDFVPAYNARVAACLQDQQGILLGKLNLDEFAMGCSTETSAFKPTSNPWDLQRLAGGSSGGSAAAVAAGEVAYSLGTDTGGSIRQPAAYCGLVGLKPTYGLVSRFGAIANTSSLDQVGVITRDVWDCALVLNAIAGYDPQDGTSVKIDVPDYTADLSGDIKGLRIAYPREYFQNNTDTAIVEQVKRALHEYEQLGAIVEEVSLPYSEYALPAYYIISRAEASTNLARYDGVQFGLRDVKADNVADLYADSRAAGFGAEVKLRILLGSYVLSADYYETYYLKAMKARRLIHDDFTRVFENHDIIITPTTPTTAFQRDEFRSDLLNLYRNDILTVPVNMAGLPGMSVPCGFIDGLPAGMQLIGKPFKEKMLLNAALAFEQAHDYYKARPNLGGDR